MRTFFALLLIPGLAAAGPAEFLGEVSFPGDAADKSGLTEVLGSRYPHDRLGGLSAIAHAGGERYLVLSDAGRPDAETGYFCRFHEIEIAFDPASGRPRAATLLATTLLRAPDGEPLNGDPARFDADPRRSRRFDPESLRLSGTSVFVGDEYGPVIREFDRSGLQRAEVMPPAGFEITAPDAVRDVEERANPRGRRPNRGFEGLALTPDGSTLVAALQAPLLQDGGREGRNVRLLSVDRRTGAARQFVYVLENPGISLTEIESIGGDEFLAIERDEEKGAKAALKRVVRLSLADATDVSGIAALPTDGLPPSVVPARREVCVDLLDPRFGLAGSDFPEKPEGLCLGPPLPDGRRLLLVAVDNDFAPNRPSRIWTFAIDLPPTTERPDPS